MTAFSDGTRIALMTVIDEEERAMLESLDKNLKRNGNGKLTSFSDYPFQIYSGTSLDQSTRGEEAFHLCYFHIGHAGNVDAGLLANAVKNDIKPDYMLLIGVAGGRSGKVKHFDIVVATDVYFYELGKIINGDFQPYNKNTEPNARLLNWAKLEKVTQNWRTLVSKVTEKDNFGSVHLGSFAAGEKVVIDSSHDVWSNALRHNPKTIATEMEAYGYLRSAWATGTPALVVRGISDLLDDKDNDGSLDENRKYEAALNAAAFALSLIINNNFRAQGELKTATIIIQDLDIEDANYIENVVNELLGERGRVKRILRGSIIVEIEYQAELERLLVVLSASELLVPGEKTRLDLSEGLETGSAREFGIKLLNILQKTASEPGTGLRHDRIDALLREANFASAYQRDLLRERLVRYAEPNSASPQRSTQQDGRYPRLFKKIDTAMDRLPPDRRAAYAEAVATSFNVVKSRDSSVTDIINDFGLAKYDPDLHHLALNKSRAIDLFVNEFPELQIDRRTLATVATSSQYELTFRRKPVKRGKRSYMYTIGEWLLLLNLSNKSIGLPRSVSEIIHVDK